MPQPADHFRASGCPERRSPSGAGPFRSTSILWPLWIALATGGCTSALEKSADFDRHRYSQLVQPREHPDRIYFDIRFSPDFPADDPAAEASRMAWLGSWLKQKSLCPGGFEVVTRREFDYLEDNPAGYQQRWEVRCQAPAAR